MRTKVLLAVTAVLCALGLVSPVAATAYTLPTVSAISPSGGPTAGGTRVTVYGTGFVHVVHVYFGNQAGATIHVVTPTELLVTAPPHGPGPVDVRVQTAVGITVPTLADRFRYFAPPSIAALNPASGPAAGGTRVTIVGAGFTSANAVVFGNRSGLSPHWVSDTEVLITAPPGTGTVDVRVESAYGTSPVTTADRFTYVPAAIAPVTAAGPTFATTTSIGVVWTPSTEPTVTDVEIRRAVGSTPPASPIDGTEVADVPAARHVFADAGLLTGQTYSYALFAHSSLGLYAPAATFTTTTQTFAFTGQANGFEFHNSGPQVMTCASTTFCMALDDSGFDIVYNGTSWTRGGGPVGNPTPAWSALSCPTATFCVAMDRTGLFSTYEGGGWTGIFGFDSNPGGVAGLSCVSVTWCMVAFQSGNVAVFDAQGSPVLSALTPVGAPTATGGRYGLISLSCVTTSFCIANDARGMAHVYDGASWTSQQLNTDGGIVSISCSSVTRCVGLDNAANEFRYVGSATWKVFPTPLHALGTPTVSCPTDTFCAAASTGAAAMTFANGFWSAASIGAPNVTKLLSCPASGLCVGLDSGGGQLRFDASGWSTPSGWVDPPHGGVPHISCADAVRCAAVADSDTLTTNQFGSWNPPQRAAGYSTFRDVACASATFCVALADSGAFSYDGATWSGPSAMPAGNWVTVTCPSATFCMAGDSLGGDATYDGVSWTRVDSTHPFITLDCPTAAYCVGIDSNGSAWVWSGGVWQMVADVPGPPTYRAVSCGAAGSCMLIDQAARVWPLTGTAVGTGVQLLGIGNVQDVSCGTPTVCAVVDSQGRFATFNGSLWSAGSPVPASASTAINQLSCYSTARCRAVDSLGDAYDGFPSG